MKVYRKNFKKTVWGQIEVVANSEEEAKKKFDNGDWFDEHDNESDYEFEGHMYYDVIRLAREDIKSEFEIEIKKDKIFEKWVDNLKENELDRIASKTGELCMEDFWLALRVVVESFYKGE